MIVGAFQWGVITTSGLRIGCCRDTASRLGEMRFPIYLKAGLCISKSYIEAQMLTVQEVKAAAPCIEYSAYGTNERLLP